MRTLHILLIVLSFVAPLRAAESLRVGVAVADITPPVGYRMSGYFSERPSTGVHDALQAKAIVFAQGDRAAAIVACDLIGIAPQVSAAARDRIARAIGVPREYVVISATHSHTGPLYAGSLRELLHNAAVKEHGSDPLEKVDYPALLVDRIVDAATRAHAALRPVTIDAVTAEQQGVSFNRRFHMKSGEVRFNPGKLNPDIVRVAGPIDPDLSFALFRDASSGKPFASLTVFALHLDTVGGTEYSADFPHYLEASLRESFGGDFVSVFGTGTCGDINHIDVSNNLPQKGQIEAKRIGDILAATIKAKQDQLQRVNSPSLRAASVSARVPLQKYDDEKIAWANEKMPLVVTSQMPFLTRVEVNKIADLQLRGGDDIALEAQAIALGDDLAIVCLPGEVFVDLGLAIKKASPFKSTMVIELCNDAPAYIPTSKAFKEGSYEVVNSRVAPGGGERLVELATEAMKRAK